MGFRERNGIGIREEMQIDSLDEGTRNLLYNISTKFLTLYGPYIMNSLSVLSSFGMNINKNQDISSKLSFDMAIILNTKYDENKPFNLNSIYNIFIEQDWPYVYEVLEAMYKDINGYDSNKKKIKLFLSSINNILEKEKCNYRMNKEGIFIKVCNDTEFESIEQTYSIAKGSAKEHLKKAVAEYSKRGGDVNYHEVCNEAIKAVEAMVRQYLGKGYEKKTLGQCLDPFRQKIGIPKFIINSISDNTEEKKLDTSVILF